MNIEFTEEQVKIIYEDHKKIFNSSNKEDKRIPPKYCEENYKHKQGGNLWHDYRYNGVDISEEEINNKILECIHILNHDARISFVNKSNGNTLIIVERSEFGDYSVYVTKGYKECTVLSSDI